MNPSRPSIKAVFDAALEIESPQEREAYLARIAADDVDLHQKVEALLLAYFNAGSFLEAPAVGRTVDMPAEPPLSSAAGTVIGPYKLLQQIGVGGMGVVYMAEQAAPVRRKVALKIIKPGMDTREVIARFEAERQALALMDHPNIARVFDGGATEAGRPYFVMELVRGVPVTEYCDQNNLPVHERLELFVTVCHAVQHAHQKGIIHRDIKPSNVLVTLHDGRPVPKVIDFGVAKAIGQQLTEKTLFTQFAQMVGTPLYMSPEQAELTGLDIDTRGDIYSLGVLLYELLTGTTPFESGRMKKAALEEIRRMIREEEPPSPSTRLSSTAGEAQTAVAAHRRVDPRGLSRLVRGDLDWIVMKALEKDRTRRYETANGFAADIGRYLSDEPVEACPPSAAYRLRKFVRRNRAGLVTASLLGLALLVATSAIGWTIRDRSAQRAETERQRVAQQLEAEQERQARQAKLEGKISEALDEAQAEYERDRLPEAIAAVKHAERLLASDDVGHDELRERVRHWQAELEVVKRLEDLGFQFSREQSIETDAAYSKVFCDIGIDVDELPIEEAGKRIRSHVTWQRLTEALDRWVGIRHEMQFIQNPSADAAIRKQRLLQVARAADADELRSQARLAVEAWDIEAAERLADSPEVSRLPASTLRQLAMLFYWGDGGSRRKSAVRLLENAQMQRPGDFQLSVACANYYMMMDPPRLAEAAHYWSVALAIRPADARIQAWLAGVYSKQGKIDEAIAGYHKAIELDPKVAMAQNNLGVALKHQGKLDEAIACYHRAIEFDPKSALAHNNLGSALNDQGKPEEADGCYRRAIQLDPKYALAHCNLGVALKDQGKLDEAIACYHRAIEFDPKSALAHNNLGAALQDQGKPDEAIACYRQAIQVDPKFSLAHYNLGFALRVQGKLDEAIACDRQAIQLDPNFALAHNSLGAALHDQGKPDEAIACFRRAIELDAKCAAAHNNLGAVREDQGMLDEAIACYRQAIQLDPKYVVAHFNLGVAFNEKGKSDEAIACYSTALDLVLDPQKKSVLYYRRGVAYTHLGRFADALTDLEGCLDFAPENLEAQNDLAWLLAACPEVKFRDAGRAVKLARRAVELTPQNSAYWNTLGVAQYRDGDIQAAVDALQKSIDLRNGGDAFDFLFLAMSRWQLGNKDEARSWYDRGVTWIEKNRAILDQDKEHDEELKRFRAEAEELLK